MCVLHTVAKTATRAAGADCDVYKPCMTSSALGRVRARARVRVRAKVRVRVRVLARRLREGDLVRVRIRIRTRVGVRVRVRSIRVGPRVLSQAPPLLSTR